MDATSLDIVDVTIVLTARHHNPSILRAGWLIQNGIVDGDWEGSGDAVTTQFLSQLAFKNGLQITAQPDRVVFLLNLTRKALDLNRLAKVVVDFAKALPHVPYKAVGINSTCVVRCDSEREAIDVISSRFVADGPWRAQIKDLAKASLKIGGDIEGRRVTVTIDSGKFKGDGRDDESSAVVFGGNIHYSLGGVKDETLEAGIAGIVTALPRELDWFREFIKSGFLT